MASLVGFVVYVFLDVGGETEVLGWVAEGLGNKEIADRLGTASGTVKNQIQTILGKLKAADRTQAVTIAIRRGILHVD